MRFGLAGRVCGYAAGVNRCLKIFLISAPLAQEINFEFDNAWVLADLRANTQLW